MDKPQAIRNSLPTLQAGCKKESRFCGERQKQFELSRDHSMTASILHWFRIEANIFVTTSVLLLSVSHDGDCNFFVLSKND